MGRAPFCFEQAGLYECFCTEFPTSREIGKEARRLRKRIQVVQLLQHERGRISPLVDAKGPSAGFHVRPNIAFESRARHALSQCRDISGDSEERPLFAAGSIAIHLEIVVPRIRGFPRIGPVAKLSFHASARHALTAVHQLAVEVEVHLETTAFVTILTNLRPGADGDRPKLMVPARLTGFCELFVCDGFVGGRFAKK